MEPQHYHEDLAAFALNALDPAERKVLEAHIAGCITCRVAAEEARCIADLLAFAAPHISPSPRLKQQLMARILAEQSARQRTLWRSWRAFGVAMTVALAVLLFWNIEMSSRMSTLNHERVMLTSQLKSEWEILANRDNISLALLGTASAPHARGTLFLRPGSRQAMLVVDGLASLPPDKIYQCWLVRGGDIVSIGRLRVSPEGHAGLVFQARDDIRSYSQLRITVEPADGTEQPRGEVVLAADL